MREFVRSHFNEKAKESTSVEDWAAFLARTWQSSGGIDVIGVVPARRPTELRFDVRSRKGRLYSRFAVLAASEDADQIEAFFATPTSTAAATGEPLAPVVTSEPDAASAIARRVDVLAAADRFSGVVLVSKRDRVLVNRAVGEADKAFRVPNRSDTKFDLGSMNKMFTAVAIAQLVEAGKMSFDSTLAKVLPDYPARDVAERVTIHQLLTHTSGIGGNIFSAEMFEHRDRYKRPRDYLPLIAKTPPEFAPGERFRYSNSGYVVLGAVVERVSGEDYFDYVKTHIFAPAGMRDTGSAEIDEVVPNLAVGYRPDDNDAFGVLPRRSNVMTRPYKGTPAGGGFATATDLAAFLQALRRHELLGVAMTETVTQPKVDRPDRPGERYGYGIESRLIRGKEIRGHGGGAPGINGASFAFADGSYTVVVLGNYDPPAATQLAEEILEFLAMQS